MTWCLTTTMCLVAWVSPVQQRVRIAHFLCCPKMQFIWRFRNFFLQIAYIWKLFYICGIANHMLHSNNQHLQHKYIQVPEFRLSLNASIVTSQKHHVPPWMTSLALVEPSQCSMICLVRHHQRPRDRPRARRKDLFSIQDTKLHPVSDICFSIDLFNIISLLQSKSYGRSM